MLILRQIRKNIEEEIESFWFSEDEIVMMIKNRKIITVELLASWCLYKNKK